MEGNGGVSLVEWDNSGRILQLESEASFMFLLGLYLCLCGSAFVSVCTGKSAGGCARHGENNPTRFIGVCVCVSVFFSCTKVCSKVVFSCT